MKIKCAILCCLLVCIAATALAVQATQFYSTGTQTQPAGPFPSVWVNLELGREVQAVPTPEAKVKHRMFAIIDRSTLQPAYDPMATTFDFRKFIIHRQLIPAAGRNDPAPWPAQTFLDFEVAVVDIPTDAYFDFVSLDGLPGGPVHSLVTGPNFFDVTYRVDVGTGGYHELNMNCVCTPGYTLSNVAVTPSGSSDSWFRVAFDMDGPGGDPVDPLIECTHSGTFHEQVVPVTGESWSTLKAQFGSK